VSEAKENIVEVSVAAMERHPAAEKVTRLCLWKASLRMKGPDTIDLVLMYQI